MRVEHVQATEFRCYERLECDLEAGLTAVVGENGAGKTSLIEAVHFGCLGWSPRTTDDARLLRYGAQATRVEIAAEAQDRRVTAAVGFVPGRPRRITLDGSSVRSADALAERFSLLVFTPDRLALVKGAPALRRGYLDRAVARLWPRFSGTARAYAAAVGQRNHLLRRIRAGVADRSSLDAWDGQVATLGAEVASARARLTERLEPGFLEHLDELGGAPAGSALRYRPAGPVSAEEIAAALCERRVRDLERCQTGAGPHLDDLALVEAEHELRPFGSQGEQRTAVLALLLAEADLVEDVRGERPCLLLDDVASELDAGRRARMLACLRGRGQVLVTTTCLDDLGSSADAVLAVSDGAVRTQP